MTHDKFFTALFETIVAFLLICAWSFVWDYNHMGEFMRDGRLKLVLFSAALLAAPRIAKVWHWTVALFFVYLAGSWLHFCFSEWVLPVGDKAFIFQVQGHEEMATITALLFLVPIVAYRIPRRTFEASVIAAGSVHSLIGILNLRGIYPFLPVTQKIDENLPIGLLGQQTILGPFLALAFAFSVLWMLDAPSPRPRLAFASLALLNLSVALLTKSSMTYGSIAVVVVVILAFYRGLTAAGIGILACYAALLVASHFDQNVFWHSGRLEPWLDAVNLLKERPWFGFGIGSWEPISRIIKEVRGYTFPWTYLHSDPLQALFELGRVGFALIALVALVVARRIRWAFEVESREALTWICALAVFGTDSIANFVLHLVPHGPIFALAIYHLLRSGQVLGSPQESLKWRARAE